MVQRYGYFRIKSHLVNQGPELQCLLKVKQDLSLVLVFQHDISNAKKVPGSMWYLWPRLF